MPLFVLVAVALVVGVPVAHFGRRLASRAERSEAAGIAAARGAGEAVGRHPRLRRLLARRLDAQAATGLALTLALAVIVGGGLLLALLTALVRTETGVIEVDRGVAEWGHDHSTPFTHGALETFTDLGAPSTVVALAVLLGLVQTLRTRDRWIPVFLVVVVGGNAALTTTIKEVVDRARPTLDPIAATFGPSFPSGHSSHSAAFFAAAALVLGRGRSARARAALAGAAAGIAAAIAASRVLLDAHWLSDVLAGLALGWAWFAACSIAFGGRLLRPGAPIEAAERAARGAGAPRRAAPAAPTAAPADREPAG